MKIKKNLPDSAMFTGEEKYNPTSSEKYVPKPSVDKVVVAEKSKVVDKDVDKNFKTGFLPDDLTEEISRALLELKIKLKKEEDIVDYYLKVINEGREVIITAVPLIKTK